MKASWRIENTVEVYSALYSLFFKSESESKSSDENNPARQLLSFEKKKCVGWETLCSIFIKQHQFGENDIKDYKKDNRNKLVIIPFYYFTDVLCLLIHFDIK